MGSNVLDLIILYECCFIVYEMRGSNSEEKNDGIV